MPAPRPPHHGTRFLPPLIATLLGGVLAACGGGSGSGQAVAPDATSLGAEASLSAPAALGAKIFADTSLSASGQMACASCHQPEHAHAPANDLAVQLGGAGLDQPGFRAVPSLRYLNLTPQFHVEADGTPVGGFNRDGRANSLAEQAVRPLLSAHEMANASPTDVLARLQKTRYVEEFRQVYGDAALQQPAVALDRLAHALAQYQTESREFHPYNSPYDQFLAGQRSLTQAQLRGLAWFNSPAKGHCAACHTSSKGADGSAPLFTDFTYDNLGVPRNTDIPATADPAYHDLGLCGPDRTDLASQAALCGAFKVPTLRNVATRRAFFHNGRFKSLRDVVAFYVRRDTHPQEWYPTGADGVVQKFNDLPPAYQRNVNTREAPYNRSVGMAPALTAQEIEDVVAFLGTLTDGAL